MSQLRLASVATHSSVHALPGSVADAIAAQPASPSRSAYSPNSLTHA